MVAFIFSAGPVYQNMGAGQYSKDKNDKADPKKKFSVFLACDI